MSAQGNTCPRRSDLANHPLEPHHEHHRARVCRDVRALSWLVAVLFRKATIPDNWDKDGTPHPHWDGISNEPTLSWHRFGLIDSCYAVALMADQIT